MNSAKSDDPVVETPAHPRSIAAVVVTFNRLPLLQECVAALRAQVRRPEEIIVVNNGSTDGTGEWLASQSGLTVITQANSGSSGGQFTGIKTAHEKGHDWIWCMDDDTVPDPGALAALANARPFGEESTGFLCSMTLDADRKVDGVLPTTASQDWWGTVLTDRCVRVDLASFVSVMYSRRAISEVGLPLKWMFIWGEDFEYSRRVAGKFKGWAVLDSQVVHKYVSKPAALDPFTDPKYRARMLFLIRNELVRVRTDPLNGRFGLLQAVLNSLYRCGGLVVRGKMPPVKTLLWICDGLFRRIRFEYPEGN
jgi:GT2 family glycosyltransferase